MKTIDYDSKIKAVQDRYIKDVPKAAAPIKTVVDKAKLAVVIKIISGELLKDPVLVSLMAMRNDCTPQSVDSFLVTVRDKIDHATGRRYREMLEEVFVQEKKNDQNV